MGLDELGKFDPQQKVIEYQLENATSRPLVHKNLIEFADETASDSPAPGGGSISAYVGALGISLSGMVANLSAGKRGWENQIAYFSNEAEKAHSFKNHLLRLVDEDTNAFNMIIDAIRMPKGSESEKQARSKAISDATKNAIEVPMIIMDVCMKSYALIKDMAKKGNPNSISDAGVAALCARAAVYGAYLNVKINCKDFNDSAYVIKTVTKADKWLTKSDKLEKEILKIVEKNLY